MSGKENSFPEEKQAPTSMWLTTTFLDSLKILLRDKCVFLAIFAILTLPLSILHFSRSFASTPLKEHVYHLEALATFVHTRFEARQVWEESREDAVSLIQLKSRFFVPSFLLSLLATITAITSTSLAYHGRKPSFASAFSWIKSTWKQVIVTSIVVYALLLLYTLIPLFLSAVFSFEPTLRFLAMAISFGVEIYLMAVTGLGLIVSVLEERYGWDAIQVGSGLMKGRQISGWVLSALLVLLSGCMGHLMGKLMDGQAPSTTSWWEAVIGGWDRAGLVCFYGAEVLWGYIVTTVFYCECRKRHVIRGEDDSVDDV